MTKMEQSVSLFARYTRTRVALHWAVVLLVIEQWYTSSAVLRTHNLLIPPAASDLLLHKMHNYAGVMIALLMVVRIGLRFLDDRIVNESAEGWPGMLARIVHSGLYFILVTQAAAGFVAAYFWKPAGQIHILLWQITLSLIALHVAAAVFHAVRRDGILRRMFSWST